jgi:hypothetical protein
VFVGCRETWGTGIDVKAGVRSVAGPVVAASVLMALTACDPGPGQAQSPPTTQGSAAPTSAGRPDPKHSVELAERFAPLVILGKDEKYRPIDATTYIESSRLMWNRDAGCPDDVVDEHPDPRSLAEPGRYRRKESADNSLPLPCKRQGPDYDTTQRTRPLDTEELGDEGYFLDDPTNALREKGTTSAPVFVQYVDGTGPNAGKTGYVYWFFYPWNRWTNPAGGVGGNHESDWERVSVVANAAGNPEGVVFSQHLTKCRMSWADVAGEGGRPTVYSAVGTHGSYPVGDARYTIDLPKALEVITALEDQTSKSGERWQTWNNVREVEREPWWGYAGGWGEVGGNIVVNNLIRELQKAQTGPAGPSKYKDMADEVFTTEPCPAPEQDQPTQASPGQTPNAQNKNGAVQRYEQFLHAVGNQDLDTVCEVAGPAAKKAEDEGLGPCRTTFPITFQLIPPEKRKALQTATVDPAQVQRKSAGEFTIPVGAIKASTTFGEDELGDATMSYLGGNWYVTD